MKHKGILSIVAAVAVAPFLVLALAGMGQVPNEAPTKMVQEKKAAEAANSIRFNENAEIDNIKRRLELTSDPGLVGYIILLNQAGQPIMYEVVKGKVTSGGKRLTDPQRKVRCDKGQYAGDCFVVSPSDEGTYGTSGEYVFYFNADGVYRQWSGTYLYSTQPFRLTTEPLVITTVPNPPK